MRKTTQMQYENITGSAENTGSTRIRELSRLGVSKFRITLLERDDV